MAGPLPFRLPRWASCVKAGMLVAIFLLMGLAWSGGFASRAAAQEKSPDEAERRSAEALRDDPTDAKPVEEKPAAKAEAAAGAPGLNIIDLFLAGGFLMWPLLGLSFLVVAVGVERALALRRIKVLPPELVRGLAELGGQQGGFDPRKAYRICQQYPCAASTIIRAMLLKVGRPHSEVEHTVRETMEREATSLYSRCRSLQMSVSVAPLIGLLGTIFGMIEAFYVTSNLGVGENKGQALAQGIYVALVTTAGGLIVAIPAALLAHHFEGRIQTLFGEIDELLFNILPQVERFEGKLRVSRQHLGDGTGGDEPDVANRAMGGVK